MKFKKVLAAIVGVLAIIGTYITFNQLSDRRGLSDPQQTEEGYGLGLPKSAGSSGGTRNIPKK